MSTLTIQLLCRKSRTPPLNYRYLLPDLAPWLTLSSSNYPCLEQFSMVPKMFEPLKFDCKYESVFFYNEGGSVREPMFLEALWQKTYTTWGEVKTSIKATLGNKKNTQNSENRSLGLIETHHTQSAGLGTPPCSGGLSETRFSKTRQWANDSKENDY